jgi:hypothetical protein
LYLPRLETDFFITVVFEGKGADGFGGNTGLPLTFEGFGGKGGATLGYGEC